MTATAIQYILPLGDSPAAVAIALLWFLSLVLSIGSAIGSQLAITWESSYSKSPEDRVPRLIFLIIDRMPLALLGASSIYLLAGIPLFLFEVYGHRHSLVPITITLCTSSLLVLFTIGCFWLLGELWAAGRREKHLEDRLFDRPQENDDIWFNSAAYNKLLHMQSSVKVRSLLAVGYLHDFHQTYLQFSA